MTKRQPMTTFKGHMALDPYSDGDSLVHRLDARVKLVVALLFVVAVVVSPPGSWIALGAYFAVISTVILASKIPPGIVMRRSLAVVPFVLMIAIFVPFFKEGQVAYAWQAGPVRMEITSEGILTLLTVLVKAWLSILALVWLTSVTRFTGLIQAMTRLHVPAVLVMIISFMYRYLFVVADEALTMKRARDSRSPGIPRLREIKSLGSIIGTLFIRSYERSERVYAAMAARGFDGSHRTLTVLTLRRSDVLFCALSVGLLISVTVFNLVLLGR